ncbi:MAG: hypothetical protein LBG80_05495 [Bacteroidales bacterium]|jgi:hypothetical protein|nr:hypothetical protein [Bacteroidales bacterium]
MKKFGLIGMAVLAVAIVNVNLNNKSSNKSLNVSKIALKNSEALTQENQEDWHSGECGTDVSYEEDYWGYIISEIKECNFSYTGFMCEYGIVTTYQSPYSSSYTVGSFSIQYCQG